VGKEKKVVLVSDALDVVKPFFHNWLSSFFSPSLPGYVVILCPCSADALC